MAGHSQDRGSDTPTFVARLWLEKGPRNTLSWRGRVKHVQGDREAYFGTLRELRAFLEEISGVPAPTDNDHVRGDAPAASRRGLK